MQVLDETSKNVRENLMTDFNTGACFISIMKLIKTTTKMLNEENIPTSGRSPGTVAAVSNYVADIFKSFGFQFNLVNSVS